MNKNILVCVTQQRTCERLINRAIELKDKYKGDIYVIHVAKNDWKFLDNAKEGEALEYLFGISKLAGANLTVLKSDTIVETIAEYAEKNNIDSIIMGQSPSDHKENMFYNQLKSRLFNTEIIVVP